LGEYDNSYYERARRPGRSSTLAAIVAKLDIILLSRRLSAGGRRGRLLEIGFGDGSFLQAMAARGWEAQGIDISAAAVSAARARPGVAVEQGDLLKKAYNPESFDLVVMRHVLEHVRDPEATLDEVRRILKPGGAVCVVVPNIESVEAKIGREHWFHLDPDYHLHNFSPETLGAALDLAGFRDIKLNQMLVEYRQTLTYSIMGRAGLDPRLPDGARSRAYEQVLFYALLPVGVLLSFALSLAGRGGTVQATARK